MSSCARNLSNQLQIRRYFVDRPSGKVLHRQRGKERAREALSSIKVQEGTKKLPGPGRTTQVQILRYQEDRPSGKVLHRQRGREGQTATQRLRLLVRNQIRLKIPYNMHNTQYHAHYRMPCTILNNMHNSLPCITTDTMHNAWCHA